jgi:hypothetical protein
MFLRVVRTYLFQGIRSDPIEGVLSGSHAPVVYDLDPHGLGLAYVRTYHRHGFR